MRKPVVETGSYPWKGHVLPLYHMRLILSDILVLDIYWKYFIVIFKIKFKFFIIINIMIE